MDPAAAFVTVLVAAEHHNDNIDHDVDTVVTSLCLEDRKEMQHLVKVPSPLSIRQYQRGVSRRCMAAPHKPTVNVPGFPATPDTMH